MTLHQPRVVIESEYSSMRNVSQGLCREEDEIVIDRVTSYDGSSKEDGAE